MEEKGQIFDMAEISVAGPLHVWDAIRRQWKRVRGSLLKNSSHLIISIQGKPDLKIKLTEGFKLTKLDLTKDKKHVFSLATIPSNGIGEVFMFSAKDDYERCVWLKKIQDSCSMHCGTIEESKQDASLPRTGTYISKDSGFSDQESTTYDKEPKEHCEGEESNQAARYTECYVSPVTRKRCDDFDRTLSAIITCPHCRRLIRLTAEAQTQGSTRVPEENDIRTGCLKPSETDDRTGEKRKE